VKEYLREQNNGQAKRESEKRWNPSRSKRWLRLKARTTIFLKMGRNVRFRADLMTLSVGPALGPLTRATY